MWQTNSEGEEEEEEEEEEGKKHRTQCTVSVVCPQTLQYLARLWDFHLWDGLIFAVKLIQNLRSC